MRFSKLTTTLAFGLFLAMPAISSASDFDQAVKEATAEINKAKAANNEWRDSMKILKKAEEAEKAGDHDKAMKLANQAKQQGILAVAQAKDQANADMR